MSLGSSPVRVFAQGVLPHLGFDLGSSDAKLGFAVTTRRQAANTVFISDAIGQYDFE
jgi:uncharacterized membrane protein YczE